MEVKDFIKNCQIICIAGGPGSRLSHRTKNQIPKHLLKIGNKTLIDYTIELYTKQGFENFIFLLGHMGEMIKNYIGDGSRYKIKPKFSIEKERLGRGLAFKEALQQGIIDRTKPCIVHYPDDIVLDPDFPVKLIKRHLIGLERGAKATLVKISGTEYRYGVPESDEEGFITKFKEKPMVEIPASIGVYVFEPEVYEIIEEIIDPSQKPVNIEPIVLNELIKRRLLFDFVISNEIWIPVNEEKEFKKAEKIMTS